VAILTFRLAVSWTAGAPAARLVPRGNRAQPQSLSVITKLAHRVRYRRLFARLDDHLIDPALAQSSQIWVPGSSGAASSGCRVIEVRESREAHQAWYDDHVAPNLPAGIGPIAVDYVELLFAVPES
jgi:hypothetical protein